MQTTGTHTGLAAIGGYLLSVHRFRVGVSGASANYVDVYVETTPAGGRCDDLRLVVYDAQTAQIYAQKLLWGEDSFRTCQHYLRLQLDTPPENNVRIGLWDGTVPWEDLALTAGNAFGVSEAFDLQDTRYHMDPRTFWPDLDTTSDSDNTGAENPDEDGAHTTGKSANTVAGIPWWGWLSGALVTGGMIYASQQN
jgi:hypothetical protein